MSLFWATLQFSRLIDDKTKTRQCQSIIHKNDILKLALIGTTQTNRVNLIDRLFGILGLHQMSPRLFFSHTNYYVGTLGGTGFPLQSQADSIRSRNRMIVGRIISSASLLKVK